MHYRRLASFLMGAWLAAGALLDFCVIQNFRAVDRFLETSGASAATQVHSLGGRAEARTFLRLEVAELNAFLFEQWEIFQFVFGIAIIGVFIFGGGEAPRAALILTILMLGILSVQRFYLTPEITRLGRLPIDAHFWMLHGISSGLELLKLALGLVAASTLLVRHTDRKRFVKEHEKMTRLATPAAQG
jgi:hypothetical protein